MSGKNGTRIGRILQDRQDQRTIRDYEDQGDTCSHVAAGGVRMQIEELLTRIAALLEANSQPDWARAFRSFYSEYQREPEETKRTIRSMYGGMGSFNDLVLHSPEGTVLLEQNDELDEMRSELYERCR